MSETGFNAVDDVSEIEEGTTVRVGESDIIHRPEGAVTGELLTNEIENGIFHVAKGDGYQPFSTSDLSGRVTWQGSERTEKVFVKDE